MLLKLYLFLNSFLFLFLFFIFKFFGEGWRASNGKQFENQNLCFERERGERER